MVDVMVKLSFFDESITSAPDVVRERALNVLRHGFVSERGNAGFLIQSIEYTGIKELNPEPSAEVTVHG